MTITLKHILLTILTVLVIGVSLFSYFTYVDTDAKCMITLRPGLMSLMEFSQGNVKTGIRALKYAEPTVYSSLCKNISTIRIDMGCGGWQGGCHYHKQGEITLSTTHSEFLGWTAAIIGHELCHDTQLREGRAFSEDECYAFDSAILHSLVDVYPQ